MQYFINMAGAEEELYKKWKEITLNSTGSDQVKIFLMLKNYCSKIYNFSHSHLIVLINFLLLIKAKYRVWDYPVKEQYTHILRVIEQTGPVSSPEEGIRMVTIQT